MTYYIFLKSLRSLEEFMKNPHIKIPSKSPPTNFQSLGIFKNQIFIRKRIFPSLSAQSAQQPAGPFGLSAHATHLAFFLLTVPAERRLFLLPRRHAMDVAPSFSRIMEPQRSPPPITPPCSIGHSYPPLHSR
jgi:hypothetical protein